MDNFWDRFRKLLVLHGLSLADISKEFDLSPSFLSVAMNRNSSPRAALAIQAADYFGVSVRWLITGEDKESIDPKYAIVLNNNRLMDFAYDLSTLSPDFIALMESFVRYEKSKTQSGRQ